jgi:hypothetical protein
MIMHCKDYCKHTAVGSLKVLALVLLYTAAEPFAASVALLAALNAGICAFPGVAAVHRALQPGWHRELSQAQGLQER